MGGVCSQHTCMHLHWHISVPMCFWVPATSVSCAGEGGWGPVCCCHGLSLLTDVGSGLSEPPQGFPEPQEVCRQEEESCASVSSQSTDVVIDQAPLKVINPVLVRLNVPMSVRVNLTFHVSEDQPFGPAYQAPSSHPACRWGFGLHSPEAVGVVFSTLWIGRVMDQRRGLGSPPGTSWTLTSYEISIATTPTILGLQGLAVEGGGSVRPFAI